MKINALGHVVLKVSDLARSERFYADVLGLPVCARFNQDGMNMVFFTLGNHHDLALLQVSGAERADAQSAGLHHVAFNIGTTLDELRAARDALAAAGVATVPIDHEVTKSLYFDDLDGNNIEVYVDVSDVWKREPQRVAQIAPLALDA
jgi:catechol 2,3-dioxygenase